MKSRSYFRIRTLCRALAIAAFSTTGYAQTNASEAALPPILPREREIALALSAAPEHVSKDAAVYVLERGGYVKAREGSNGFSCLVWREGPRGTAPICYDAEGSQTTLVANLQEVRLREQGKSPEEIENAIADGYRTGKFMAPRRPGIAYMLSPENHLHDPRTGETFHYPPHVMLYAPYMKNSDIGASAEQRGSLYHPWILNEDKPDAYIIVVPKQPGEAGKP